MGVTLPTEVFLQASEDVEGASKQVKMDADCGAVSGDKLCRSRNATYAQDRYVRHPEALFDKIIRGNHAQFQGLLLKHVNEIEARKEGGKMDSLGRIS